MSSGWPPEDDDRRWEPARHPSAVGAVHDSRDAERGYSGFAPDAAGQYPEAQFNDGQYSDGQYDDGQFAAGYAEDQYAEGQYAESAETGWYGTAETSYPAADYQPEPDNAGYGEVSYPDVYNLNDGAPHQGYAPPAYGPPAGYTEHPSFPNLPAQPHGYQPEPDHGQLDHGQLDYGQVDYGQAGYAQPGQPAPSAEADYGYADYGDDRYNDPNFGDPAYEAPQATGHPGPAPAAAAGYYQYPPSYDDTDATGYVAAEYATGMVDASGMLDSTGIADGGELYDYHPGTGAEAAHAFTGAPAPMGTLDSSGLAMAPDATTIDGHPPILGGAQAADAAGVLDGGTASAYFAGAQAFQAAPTFTPAPGFEGDVAEVAAYTGQSPAFTGEAPAYTGQSAAYAGDTSVGLAPAANGASGPLPAFAVAPEATSLDLSPADSFGLGPADGTKTGGTGALLRPRSTRPAGKRRGGSGDKRLWFALGGVLAIAAAAIVAIVLVAFPSGPSGPAHTLVSPNQLGAFSRRPALEQQMNVGQLRQDVINTSSGQAKHIVEGVYESGNSTSGSTPQIILLIAGNLANSNPVDSVTSFTKRFPGATLTSAGALGGKAVCVNATASEPGSVAMCAWFDNDSFGEVVSPTMKASTLGNTMRQIRPSVEQVAKQKS
jgi:hypothetical protein